MVLCDFPHPQGRAPIPATSDTMCQAEGCLEPQQWASKRSWAPGKRPQPRAGKDGGALALASPLTGCPSPSQSPHNQRPISFFRFQLSISRACPPSRRDLKKVLGSPKEGIPPNWAPPQTGLLTQASGSLWRPRTPEVDHDPLTRHLRQKPPVPPQSPQDRSMSLSSGAPQAGGRRPSLSLTFPQTDASQRTRGLSGP